MDVPTRQSSGVAVMARDERTLASGITPIVRLAAWAVAPAIAGVLARAHREWSPRPGKWPGRFRPRRRCFRRRRREGHIPCHLVDPDQRPGSKRAASASTTPGGRPALPATRTFELVRSVGVWSRRGTVVTISARRYSCDTCVDEEDDCKADDCLAPEVAPPSTCLGGVGGYRVEGEQAGARGPARAPHRCAAIRLVGRRSSA